MTRSTSGGTTRPGGAQGGGPRPHQVVRPPATGGRPRPPPSAPGPLHATPRGRRGDLVSAAVESRVAPDAIDCGGCHWGLLPQGLAAKLGPPTTDRTVGYSVTTAHRPNRRAGGATMSHENTEVYLVEGVRTPQGKYGGALASVRPDDLAALVVGEALRRSGAPAEAVE